MTRLLFADTETYSECDLKTAGAARYAEDESTEITIAQWALDDDEPTVWDCTEHGVPQAFIDLMNEPDVIVVWHNGFFDRLVMAACWDFNLPPEKCLDTMIQSYAHGMPGALGKVGEVLGLPLDEQKDKRGAQLIQMFAKPRPKNHALRRATRLTHPKEWAEFLSYSYMDIVSMRAVFRAAPKWNFRPGHAEHALWCLDQRINTRGVLLDLNLARSAIAAVEVEKVRLKKAVQNATLGEVSGPSKRDDMLRFIVEAYGVELPDFRADTLRRRLEDPELPDGVKLLLSLRLEATKTSTAKYKAMLHAVNADGRLRGALQFAGAQRTARWAGRIVQLQNMPRPTMKDYEIDAAIYSLKAGCATDYFDDVMSVTSNAIRGCIVAPPGKKLVVADLSNIEGRMLAWLAGEEWKLRAFAAFDAGTGADLYKLAYARSFNVDPETATGQKRQIGKVMELGLGYEGGVAAFLTFAAVYQMDLAELADAVHTTAPKEVLAKAYGMWEWAERKKRTLGLERNVYVACEALKAMWRAAHPATVALWGAAGDAVRSAIQNPGVAFDAGPRIKVQRDGAWLRCRLPSGRYVCYLQPQVADDGQISYMGVSQYTRQWTRLKTYGGKIIENMTQAVARDVLASSMPAVESAGYEIVLTVHDELITEALDTDDYSAEHLATLMSARPSWALDAPLSAAGFETHRYRKG